MKIKNVTLSLMGCSILALGLLELNVLAAEDDGKDIGFNATNAVQHIDNVKIIAVEGGQGILKSAGNSLVGVIAKNFIISQTGENINIIGANAVASNILGGSKNMIGEALQSVIASTILGGEINRNYGNYSTVLGGYSNKIREGNYSTIIGGTNNELKGNGSVIVGGNGNELVGDYSAVLGSNAGVHGNNSVALGENSKNYADNSFLWTDGVSRPELTTDNVFVVNSEHGMVVNEKAAHSFAKLTIGGPLVIQESENAVSCDGNHKGVLRVVKGQTDNANRKCFCSCDGNGYWHSLYGQGKCEGICNRDLGQEKDPGCGAVKIENDQFKGGCTDSSPAVGYGAYFVDKDGKVYWTCQTDAGKSKACSGFVAG